MDGRPVAEKIGYRPAAELRKYVLRANEVLERNEDTIQVNSDGFICRTRWSTRLSLKLY